MTRRMADPTFRAAMVAGMHDEHIAPINDLVDAINAADAPAPAPHVAPMYGGVAARLLSVLSDPGPGTKSELGGSGFLCMENDDATAERILGLFHGAGIAARDVVPWNAYPWYINRKPLAAELEAGVQPWMDLMGLMPKLRVVMLHGGIAKDGWRRLTRRHPTLVADRQLVVIETFHTSRQAFFHPDPAVRQQRADHLQAAFETAAAALAES